MALISLTAISFGLYGYGYFRKNSAYEKKTTFLNSIVDSKQIDNPETIKNLFLKNNGNFILKHVANNSQCVQNANGSQCVQNANGSQCVQNTDNSQSEKNVISEIYKKYMKKYNVVETHVGSGITLDNNNVPKIVPVLANVTVEKTRDTMKIVKVIIPNNFLSSISSCIVPSENGIMFHRDGFQCIASEIGKYENMFQYLQLHGVKHSDVSDSYAIEVKKYSISSSPVCYFGANASKEFISVDSISTNPRKIADAKYESEINNANNIMISSVVVWTSAMAVSMLLSLSK